MDSIFISGLLIRAILGVNEDERREKQDILFDIVLHTDLRSPGTSDRFQDAIDYRALKKRIIALVEQSSFKLLEALAAAVADICLDDLRVDSVMVRVEKPTALRFARGVGVQITRSRPNR